MSATVTHVFTHVLCWHRNSFDAEILIYREDYKLKVDTIHHTSASVYEFSLADAFAGNIKVVASKQSIEAQPSDGKF